MPESVETARPPAGPSLAPQAAVRDRAGFWRRRPAADELAALFPEFVGDPTAVWYAGRRAAAAARHRARASARGFPFVRIGEGLLRAPPRPGGPRPWLGGAALAIAGPPSPADMLSPGRVLATRSWETPALLTRAAAARRALVAERVGGEWWHSDAAALGARDGLALVCLAEPPAADGEVAPPIAALRAMLGAALGDNPANRIVVLAPGISGRRAALRPLLADAAGRGALILTRPLDPWAVLARVERVYTVGGELGLLGLLAGRTVCAFGAAFYTGWGATRDAAGLPQRRFTRSIDEIFAGGVLVATRHLDPFRKVPTSFEEVLAILGEWRRLDHANRRIAVCVGMSWWKRRRIADFVRSSAGTPPFRRGAAGALAAAGSDGAIAAWASRVPPGLAKAAAERGIPLIRVEDGFLRSVGLGSDFLPAASLVFDAKGMYFDPRRPSDLETLLREAEFDAPLVARARRLRAQLVARGVTKYNVAARRPPRETAIAWPESRPRILVPGQVEDDLSVLLGGGDIHSNLDLLARVRAANPAAFILYKPHPDVVAGHRPGAVPAALARHFADAVVEGGSTALLLAEIDELHTLSSLAGFEALLRGKRVVVYGRPFYAGWGLTDDRAAPDRGRRLRLDELVAGALILYPRYIDPLTRLPCGPELVIERLADPGLWRPGPLVLARRLEGALMRRWAALPSRSHAAERFLR